MGSLVGELTTDVNSTVEHLRELGEIPTVIITTCIYKTAHKGSRTGCKENEILSLVFRPHPVFITTASNDEKQEQQKAGQSLGTQLG